jgi:hypothetical protein
MDKKSSDVALFSINFDIKHDLDLMVGTHVKLYTAESELCIDYPEIVENN